jgi:predicted NAD-dependent protein-ADP-ribosyltransferase YbiA (DUF1768 family)
MPHSEVGVILWGDEDVLASGCYAGADLATASALGGSLANVLRRRWSTDRPDVVQADCWLSGLAALRSARPLDIPVVVARTSGAVHPWEEVRVPSDDVELRLRLGADHTLARDEEDLGRLHRSPGGSSVSWQPVGVDTPPPATCGELREPRRLATVVHLGMEHDGARLLDMVDQRDGLREVLLLVPDRPAAVAQISGRLAVAMAVARGRGIETRLVGALSTGRRMQLLRSASVFVYAPEEPPSDRAVVEAMAAGCLVVASANGRLSGLVHDGINGLVVEAGSDHALRSALAAGAHPSVAAQLGRRAAGAAESRYSWASVAVQARDVFKTLL